MNSFDQALKAFQLSSISFDELLQIARRTGQAAEPTLAEAKRCLDAEFQAGRLSPQNYAALDAELSDKTHIAPPARQVTVVPSAAPRGEQATLIQDARTATAPPTVMDTESLLSGLRETHPHEELTVGSTLKNRFVLQQLLGVGGMGMVFKATDLRKIEAQDKEPYVALKVLNQDFQANPMALVSLQRETKRAQTLSHPNIIKVYDFDRDGGHVFMSMEYLEGKPLSHLIKEHPEGMPFKQAWPIIHAMADALRHAHKKSIVHSDFKPGNVFIDNSDEVRVLDFGIACAIGRGDKDHQDATVFNARSLGAYTPAYASLEQLQNSDPDPRDDIYALACVSYELLTGKHPFGRLSAEKAQEVNLQVKPVAKLSRRQFKGLQKALAFEQAQRTKTVDAFLSALGPRSTVFYGLWGTGVFAVGLFAANIYLSMIAPPKIVEAPKVNVQLSPEQQQKIKDLLELAGIHADVGYLTAPTGSNALWAYREALKIDPYNKAAANGIIGIADTLEQQAWEAYERNDRSTALKRVQDGLEAYPTHKGLLSLREKLRASQ
ncbi:serine/threonine protein kinase [Methylomonas sp. SURF-2]|uniref:Serine/threonine protein kinase n=1 Tax=Methylomonas subterranea TaxID=2952225 RepID=A0ABT1TDN4_9GAMM|nr:serine/threonine-protein kinase [Methylomonas sp. SURF-2]MCQ8103568.1 serine/threonine protein kinase [Methylomonas sp. SURF-2]